jgi:hypothetical protein
MITEGIINYTTASGAGAAGGAGGKPGTGQKAGGGGEVVAVSPSSTAATGELANLASLAASASAGDGDLSELAQEVVVGGFLGVQVTKSAKTVRKKDDAKMHTAFEVSIVTCDILSSCWDTLVLENGYRVYAVLADVYFCRKPFTFSPTYFDP